MRTQVKQWAMAGAAALVAAAGAAGQCSWTINGMPDFDQRREGTQAQGGLPGNGGMYCVPTAAVNLYAFFANRGSPQPATLNGPRDWQSQNNYVRVSDTLRIMGALMGTSATGGTNGNGAVAGTVTYNFLYTGGDFVLTRRTVWGTGGEVSPWLMNFHRALGGYSWFVYGRYGSSTGGTRDGGHAITLTGLWGNCTSGTIVFFRDPWNGSSRFSQAAFANNMAALTRVTGSFRPKSSESFETRSLWRMDTTGNSQAFVDGLYTLWPQFAVSSSSTDLGSVQLIRPWVPDGSPVGNLQSFPTPAGTGGLIAVAPDTDGVRVHVLLDRGSQAAGAWTLDTSNGAWTRYYTESPSSGPTALRLMTMGRLGDVYVLDGRSLRRFDTRVQPPVQVGLYATPGPVQAMTYDDKADRVVMLSTQPTSGPRRVYSISRSMGDLQTWDLPVTLTGDVWIQEDPGAPQSYWVMGSQTGILRRVQVAIGGGLALVESAGFILNPSLSNLNVVDGPRLIFANNGQLIELEKNAAGSWVNRPGSRWAGRTVSGPLHVARSRSDFDAVREVGPTFNNILDPIVYPQLGGMSPDPDCWANCDGSTLTPRLSPADFVCFLNLYRQGTTGSLISQWSSYANCDESTGTPVLTPADFVCFLNKYRAGCN